MWSINSRLIMIVQGGELDGRTVVSLGRWLRTCVLGGLEKGVKWQRWRRWRRWRCYICRWHDENRRLRNDYIGRRRYVDITTRWNRRKVRKLCGLWVSTRVEWRGCERKDGSQQRPQHERYDVCNTKKDHNTDKAITFMLKIWPTDCVVNLVRSWGTSKT